MNPKLIEEARIVATAGYALDLSEVDVNKAVLEYLRSNHEIELRSLTGSELHQLLEELKEH